MEKTTTTNKAVKTHRGKLDVFTGKFTSANTKTITLINQSKGNKYNSRMVAS
jgi:hypothetical protein